MRVWFNQWFSTAYHLIALMRAGSPGRFTFVGSSANPNMLYRLVCDAWETEPVLPVGTAYVEYALRFCRAQGIDVFFPRRALTILAQHQDAFRAQGTILAAGAADTMALLDDKAATYAFFAEHLPEIVPAYRVAHSYEAFAAAYEELRPCCARVCYKLTEDEGATTFRVIDESVAAPGAIARKPGTKLTWAMAQQILRGYDFSVPFLLMPYLDGQEVSVDCLQTARGAIVIPRFKTDHRYSEIRFDADIMALCERIMTLLQIPVPINIQLRSDGAHYYLLEINPRMSGGLQLSCLAAGINVPDIAVNRLVGTEKPWAYPDRSRVRRVANLETPQLLEG